MRTSLIITAVVLTLAMAAATIACQEEGAERKARAKPRGINWVPSLERAKQQAAKRESPILVAIHRSFDAVKEAEKYASQQKMVAAYRDPAVVKACKPFVCVIVSLGWKAAEGENPKARRFGRLTAKQNESLEKELREAFFKSERDVVAPQHLVLRADGSLVDRYLLARSPQEFARLLKNAHDRSRGKAPVDVVTADPKAVIRALKDGDDALKEKAFRQAVAILGADKDNKAVRNAAEQYLRTMKATQAVKTPLQAIDQAGTEGAILLLLPFLKHRNENVRRKSLDVIAGAEPFKSMLKPLAQRTRTELEEKPLRSLVKALDAYADEFDEALAQLNVLVSHKREATKVLATFAAARPENKAIYAKLLARARAEKAVQVRVAAILGLALMEAKKALPTLQALREKPPKENDVVGALNTAITILGGEITVQTERQLEREVREARRTAGATEDDDKKGGGKRGRGRRGKRKGKGKR